MTGQARFDLKLSDWTPKVATGRETPVFWLERIVFLDGLEQTGDFRLDRTFRRGLNIVWATDENGGGHGAGKSTLMGFIRYVLGDNLYGDIEFQDNLEEAFPKGYIAAQILIGETRWSVFRPVRNTTLAATDSFCGKDIKIEDKHALIKSGNRSDYSVFQNVLYDAIQTYLPCGKITAEYREAVFAKIVKWCTREQECHFKGVTSWRAITPDIWEDKDHLIIRLVLGLVSAEEETARANYEKAEKQKTEAKNALDRAKRNLASQKAILAGAFPVDAATDPDQPDMISPDQIEKARKRIEEKNAEIEALVDNKQVREWAEQEDTLRNTAKDQLKQVREIDEKLSPIDQEIEEKQGEWNALDKKLLMANTEQPCPWCERNPSDMMRKYTPLKDIPESDLAVGIQNQMKELERSISGMRESAQSQRKERLKLLTRAETSLQQVRELVYKREKLQRDSIRQVRPLVLERAHWENAVKSWEGFEPLKTEVDKKTEQLKEATRALKEAEGKVKEAQSGQREILRKINDCFLRVTQRITDGRYSASIEQGVVGEIILNWERVVKEKSTAIDALKVILFDYAVLLASMEHGLGFPGFLTHDSPRVADLQTSDYAKLFLELARWTEAFATDQAPFQYIISTTTAPPEGKENMYINRRILDASKPEGRLLGVDL